MHLQKEQIQAYKDEIAILKGEKPKPKIKPSKLESDEDDDNNKDDNSSNKPKRPGSKKKAKKKLIKVHKTKKCKVKNLPKGGKRKGYEESGRTQLSRIVCDMLNWRQPNGHLKDMACRVAMLRMQDDGLIQPHPAAEMATASHINAAQSKQDQNLDWDLTAALIATALDLELVSKRPRSHL